MKKWLTEKLILLASVLTSGLGYLANCFFGTDEVLECSLIKDDEVLYRSIELKPENFALTASGDDYRLSSQAFADRMYEPSLFRHILCENPPLSKPPRMSRTDAVAELVAGKVREISPVKYADHEYVIDIRSEPDPPHHKSHCVVFAAPQFPKDKAFRRLKERLAFLARDGMIIPPPTSFLKELRK